MQKHGWKNVLEPTVVDVASLKEKALIAFRDRLPWQPIKNIGKLIEPIFHIPFFFILKWFVATWPSMMDGWWMSSRLTQLLESIPTPGLRELLSKDSERWRRWNHWCGDEGGRRVLKKLQGNTSVSSNFCWKLQMRKTDKMRGVDFDIWRQFLFLMRATRSRCNILFDPFDLHPPPHPLFF